MKALISPEEISYAYDGSEGQRVAEVEQEVFEVAPPLHWVDCPDDCVADEWYFVDGQCIPKPQPEPEPETPVEVLP